jgi:hypothetical protein
MNARNQSALKRLHIFFTRYYVHDTCQLPSKPEHLSLFPSSVQLIKLMQKKCNSIDPSTKSANARSCEMLSKSALFSGLVWMRSEAVRTNWPTVALKPERKALKGCNPVSRHSFRVHWAAIMAQL